MAYQIYIKSLNYGDRVSPPLVLAVSKTKSIEAISAVYDEGCRHFGENFAHEIIEKSKHLPSDIKWHMIGHVQSNKVSQLLSVPNLHVIETIDSIKLAQRVNDTCVRLKRDVQIMIQVNVSGEATKSGVSPKDALSVADHVSRMCPFLQFVGFMTIGDKNEPVEGFKIMKEMKDKWNTDSCGQNGAKANLSMGMSGDADLAIKWDTDELRIGSAIFGPRVV
eukprot:GHVO01013230.1.p1 GENE.GHVO01013230.1~~GHVO01013230.1.p1  ORF type:complete len:221 (-),score=31.00 GHVO01013230.1:137-799(-)